MSDSKTTKGIDVSHWQGKIDFKKVASLCDFVIIKAGGGDAGKYKDSKFETNYKNARAAGLSVGAYYFAGRDFTSEENGRVAAEHFASLIDGKTFEYPVYLDVEMTPPSMKRKATDAAISFCRTMEEKGYYVGIYASDIGGFKDRLDLSRLGDFDKWVARYGSKPKYVKSFGVWQSTSKGVMQGIKGYVDMDTAYIDYPSVMKRNHLNGH